MMMMMTIIIIMIVGNFGSKNCEKMLLKNNLRNYKKTFKNMTMFRRARTSLSRQTKIE